MSNECSRQTIKNYNKLKLYTNEASVLLSRNSIEVEATMSDVTELVPSLSEREAGVDQQTPQAGWAEESGCINEGVKFTTNGHARSNVLSVEDDIQAW